MNNIEKTKRALLGLADVSSHYSDFLEGRIVSSNTFYERFPYNDMGVKEIDEALAILEHHNLVKRYSTQIGILFDGESTEEDFLSYYSFSDYPGVAVTVDLAIFTIKNNDLSILLIKRDGHPYKEKWALPGGFINQNESIDAAAARELVEETNIKIADGHLEQLRTYGSPERDPRGYVTSIAYVALAPNVALPIAGDDASDARFFPVKDVLGPDFDLAFDHAKIISDGLERVQAKIEYAPIAPLFIESNEFTISELRKVYEIVWGKEFDFPANFRRKVLSVPGFLTPQGGKRTSNIDGGRASDLYTLGDAKMIFPPLSKDLSKL